MCAARAASLRVSEEGLACAPLQGEVLGQRARASEERSEYGMNLPTPEEEFLPAMVSKALRLEKSPGPQESQRRRGAMLYQTRSARVCESAGSVPAVQGRYLGHRKPGACALAALTAVVLMRFVTAALAWTAAKPMETVAVAWPRRFPLALRRLACALLHRCHAIPHSHYLRQRLLATGHAGRCHDYSPWRS